ncbi:MAG TPA: hypothetical protein VFR14_07270 [Candidatus Limnocylindrales bacterium]|nr:hypothetical protein [Candidatus Limnocylindrales bacterium]
MPAPGRIGAAIVAATSLLIGLVVIRPFADAPVGFDTQATVLYFERIVAGTRLEQALTTTPKPMLTFVYGSLHAVTGDWRPIIWLTMIVHAGAAWLATVVLTRSAGLAAGIAAGLVVAGTPLLIEDTAFGNGVPWALFGWLLAALLLSGEQPRPAVAGVVLALAALARLETLVLVAGVALALGWLRWGPWPLPGPRPTVHPRTWLALAIPLLALPAMLVHDWLLTGDPLFWLAVSQRYSDAIRASRDVLDPLERTTWFVRRYLALWPVLPFAVVGLVELVRTRRWGALTGLAVMGAGIAAFLVLLAARGIYAPHRYAIPVDLAVLFVAAVGFGRLVDLAAARVARRSIGRSAATGVAFLAVIGVVALVGRGPFDPGLAQTVGDLRAVNEHAARVGALVRDSALLPPENEHPRILVPTPVRPRIAVDLGLPLDQVGGLSPRALDPATASYAIGQVVIHDRRGDVPRGEYAVLETDTTTSIGGVILEPRFSDEAGGLWVYVVTDVP